MDPNVLNLIQGAAGAGGGDPVYVEEVFSTDLFTGTGSAQTIDNGIDLDGEGGMVWFKSRTTGGSSFNNHSVVDTERVDSSGRGKSIYPNLNSAQYSPEGTANITTSFNSNGYTTGTNENNATNTQTLASWTFRKAPGFFDIVEWTGNSTAGREIPHNLGSVPGMIFVKCVSNSGHWAVYHKDLTSAEYLLRLNDNYDEWADSAMWDSTAPTSTVFTVGADPDVNYTNYTYVAYIFAHDDQSFGDDEDESIIKCGTYTGNSSADFEVDLGWEPQYIMFKSIDGDYNWSMFDSMRGIVSGGDENYLYPNLNVSEYTAERISLTPNGFIVDASAGVLINNNGDDYIYMAIRRGPMKTPEAGTEVFAVEYISTPTSGTTKFTTNFPVDMSWANVPSQGTIGWIQDRLRGYPKYGLHATQDNYQIMRTHDNYGESTFQPNNPFFLAADKTSITYGNGINNGDNLSFAFGRAPGFFDVVAYAGTGSYGTVPHNLGAIPYLIIVKNRSAAYNWYVQSYDLGKDTWLQLNNAEAKAGNGSLFDSTLPTDSVFSVANMSGNNASGNDYIAYLFGKLPGVCEIGTYEGTGQNGGTTDLDFGFSPRFLLIKNADTNNYSWALFDSATGMSSSVGKYIRPNQSYDYASGYTGANAIIDNITDGVRILDGNSGSELNQSGDTHLYLAIA